MGILKYKYKAHRLVNYIFYVGIFIFGFLLGFTVKKIDFSEIVSQVLFIDSASAETLTTCRDSYNLFNVTNYENIEYMSNGNAIITLTEDNVIVISSGSGYSGFYIQPKYLVDYIDDFNMNTEYTVSFDVTVDSDVTLQYGMKNKKTTTLSSGTTRLNVVSTNEDYSMVFYATKSTENQNIKISNIMFSDSGYIDYEKYDQEVCIEDDNFYNFANQIVGELEQEDYWVYDFVTLILVSVVLIIMVTTISFIIKILLVVN